MNTRKVSLLLAMILFATTAFAANKASLRVFDPVTVNGQSLPAGNYTLSWEGNGPQVDLTIIQNKKVLITTPARLLNLSATTQQTTVLSKIGANGERAVSQIQLGGKNFAFDIE